VFHFSEGLGVFDILPAAMAWEKDVEPDFRRRRRANFLRTLDSVKMENHVLFKSK